MNASIFVLDTGLSDASPQAVAQILASVTVVLAHAYRIVNAIPGSAIALRYIRTSHQNDPWRTLFEILLFAFAVRTVFSSRTRNDQTSTNFVKLTEKEIDELVADWTPNPLVDPHVASSDQDLLAELPIIQGPTGARVRLNSNPNKVVLNLTSTNFTGLAEDERMVESATKALRTYGVGTCGPFGFVGMFDAHNEFERSLAAFLGQPSAILCAQDFACVTSVIPSFAKRGDYLIVDSLVNFAVLKGCQVSRSIIRFYKHGDMSSLEQVLESVDREARRKDKLTRRFIVTEGLFEYDGWICNLERIVALKKKYKARLILDESYSLGVLGATGRGVTELWGVSGSEVDIHLGSMANSFASGGGFCAGSDVVTRHQRINSAAFVFSASLPVMFATTSSVALQILQERPAVFVTLAEYVQVFRLMVDKLDGITSPSHPLSPLVHLQLVRPVPVDQAGVEEEERLLQAIVQEAQSNGVLLTRTRRLKGQEEVDVRSSIKISLSTALTRKEMDKAVWGVKAAVVKVLGRGRRGTDA